MPLSHSFDGRIIVIRPEGRYPMVQLKNQVLEALSDPALPAAPVLMFDLRQSVSVQERSTDEVRDMAEFLAAHAEQFSSRIGMVTGSELAYGVMRMGTVFAESGGMTPKVFRDYQDARQWLTSTKGAE